MSRAGDVRDAGEAEDAAAVARRDDPDASPVRVEIRRGDPTPEELAAVVAVVTQAYQRETAEAIAEQEPRPTAWQVSSRTLRTPLRREIGWGRFGG